MVQRLLHKMRHSDMALGYLCAGVGLSLFAMKGIVIKLAYEEQLDTLITLTWRMILSLPFYVVIGLWLWRGRAPEQRAILKQRKVFWSTVFCGVMSYYVSSYLDFKGLETVSAQFERLTLYTYPFFVLLFSAILLGARVTGFAILSLLVSYAGIAIIFIHDMPSIGVEYWEGTAFVMAAALAYAFQQVISKPYIHAVGSRLFTCVAMVAASIAVFTHFLLTSSVADLSISMQAFWLLLVLAFFCTVCPTFLLNEAVRRIGPQHASSMGGVGPVVTIIAAVVILGEAFTLSHALGTVLVLVGVGLFSKHKA